MCVVDNMFHMLPAINFYGNASFHADKVHHILSNGLLSTKSIAGKLAHAQLPPQKLFCIS